jgi:hypothetical protein
LAYAKTTFTQLKTRLAQRVGGQGTFWAEAEAEIALNEALNVWHLLVGEFQATGVLLSSGISQEVAELYVPGSSTINIKQETATTSSANMPLSILRMATVVHTTTGALFSYPKLQQISWPDLDYGFSGWKTGTAGTPDYWLPFGVNKVIFSPRPNQTIKVDYYRGDRLLNVNTDYIQLGDEEINRILDYAVWQMNVKSGTEEAFGTTGPLKELFMFAAEFRNQKLRSSQLYKDFLGADYGEAQPLREAVKQKAARGDGEGQK